MRYAQTSTEYLVVIAVVIIIALIVVVTMGGIPGISSSKDKTVINQAAALENIGIVDFKVTHAGVMFYLKNNLQNTIKINSIMIDDEQIAPSGGYPFSLALGQKKTIQSYTGMTNYEAEQVKIHVNYTDGKTSAQYQQKDVDVAFDLPSLYFMEDVLAIWHFEDDWSDGTGNGHTGAAQADAAITTSGKFGNAVTFDGTGDYVNIPASSELDFDDIGNYTWSAWIYPSAGDFAIFHKVGSGSYSGYTIYLESSKFCINDNIPAATESCTTETVTLNTWTHVAINYSSETFTLFIDGDAKKTDTIAGFADATLNLMIGYSYMTNDFGATFSNGRIDEAAIWNRALTGDEIAEIYRYGR